MAATLVNSWAGTASTGSAASKTVSVTVSSNSNRVLLIWSACYNSSDYLASATCTVNGTSAGSPVVTLATGAASNFVYAWLVTAPTSGTYNVVVTPSSSAVFDVIISEWQGVDQTTPSTTPSKSVNGFQTSPVSLTLSPTAASGDVITDLCSIKVTGQTLTPGGTRIGSQINGVSGSISASQTAGAASSSSWTFTGSNSNVAMAAIVLKGYSAPDTTAPTLTSPVGTATGATTATVGATTDEANGTAYAVVTTSATQPSVAQIKAGQNDTGATAVWAGGNPIAATGAFTMSANALTASTTYYAHLVHTDAASNDSNRVTSASFTTSASSDTTPPTLTGSITVGTVSATTIQISWPTGSDNVAVTSYDVSSNSGSSWTNTGSTATSYTFTGLTAATSYTLQVRARDAAGNTSTPVLSVTQSTSAAGTGTIAMGPFSSSGTLWPVSSSVRWEWRERSSPNSTPTSITYGTSTIATAGVVLLTGLPSGDGDGNAYVIGATRADDKVGYYYGTVA